MLVTAWLSRLLSTASSLLASFSNQLAHCDGTIVTHPPSQSCSERTWNEDFQRKEKNVCCFPPFPPPQCKPLLLSYCPCIFITRFLRSEKCRIYEGFFLFCWNVVPPLPQTPIWRICTSDVKHLRGRRVHVVGFPVVPLGAALRLRSFLQAGNQSLTFQKTKMHCWQSPGVPIVVQLDARVFAREERIHFNQVQQS